MGVIQNSMNQMLATGFGVALGAKHFAGKELESIKSNVNEYVALKGEIPKAKEVISGLQENVGQAQHNVDVIQKRADKQKISKGNISPVTQNKLEKARLALESAQGELDSTQLGLKLKEARFAELKNPPEAGSLEWSGLVRMGTVNRIKQLEEKEGGKK